MSGGTARHAPPVARAFRPRGIGCRLLASLSVLAFISGCAIQNRRMPPDWENRGERLVGAQLAPLLQAAGRDPAACELVFLETEKLNAASEGQCRFAVTKGLAATEDRTLIEGIAAHEVAHEILGHADKRALAIGTVRVLGEALSQAPGWGPVAGVAVLAVGMVALPAYSRAQETEADSKALEILQARGSSDPAGTMAYAFETLLTREGATGGGLLSSHPAMTARLDALRPLRSHEPCTGPAPEEPSGDPPLFAVPITTDRFGFRPGARPPDPRADWSPRYKRMAASATASETGDEALQPRESEADIQGPRSDR